MSDAPKTTIDSAANAAHAVGKIPQGSLSLILMFMLCSGVLWIQTDTMREVGEAAKRNADAAERFAATMEQIALNDSETDAAFLELMRQEIDLRKASLKESP